MDSGCVRDISLFFATIKCQQFLHLRFCSSPKTRVTELCLHNKIIIDCACVFHIQARHFDKLCAWYSTHDMNHLYFSGACSTCARLIFLLSLPHVCRFSRYCQTMRTSCKLPTWAGTMPRFGFYLIKNVSAHTKTLQSIAAQRSALTLGQTKVCRNGTPFCYAAGALHCCIAQGIVLYSVLFWFLTTTMCQI